MQRSPLDAGISPSPAQDVLQATHIQQRIKPADRMEIPALWRGNDGVWGCGCAVVRRIAGRALIGRGTLVR